MKMNDNQLKKLYEIMNHSIGGKITQSMSMMLGETFKHDLRRVMKVEFSDIDHIVEPFVHQKMCAVYLKTEGDMRFGMLFFLPEHEAKALAARLLGKQQVDSIDAMGRSSISEVGNILLAGSFLNTISETTGFTMDCSAPGFAVENVKAVLGDPVAEVAARTDSLVVADAQLSAESGIKVHIVILVGVEDALKLLASTKEAAA